LIFHPRNLGGEQHCTAATALGELGKDAVAGRVGDLPRRWAIRPSMISR
jgi:hypothetical protein